MQNNSSNEFDLYALAKKFFIAPAVVDRLQSTFANTDDLRRFMQAIKIPSRHFYFRINLTKMTPESIGTQLHLINPKFQPKLHPIPNILSTEIIGPMQRSPSEKRIYCNKFAAESILMGADLFLPGVKTIPNRFGRGEKLAIHFEPDKKSSFQYTETETYLANGTSVLSSQEFPQHTKGIFIKNTEPQFQGINFRENPLFQSGIISEHSFPPIIATNAFIDLLFQTRQEETAQIIDLCSAPGHKTAAMAEYGAWKNKCQSKALKWLHLLSIDRSPNRLEHLQQNIHRLELQNINIIAMHLEQALHEYPNLPQSGDFVILDPPCSALGNRPKLFIDQSAENLTNYVTNQQRLLKYADKYVKQGGYLMYNTCTIPREENEDMIADFITKNPYQIIPIPTLYRKYGKSGLPTPTLSKAESDAFLRFYPDIEDGMGYFIAILQKK